MSAPISRRFSDSLFSRFRRRASFSCARAVRVARAVCTVWAVRVAGIVRTVWALRVACPSRFARTVGVFFLISALAGLTGCSSSDPVLGVVDAASIVQDGTPGRNAVAHLAQVREVLQGNLNAVVNKLEKYPHKGQAQQILLEMQTSFQKTLDAHESQVNALLTEALQAAVSETRAAKKLDAVVSKDSLMDYDAALNISPAVLVAFEKKALQFPLVPSVVADPQLPAPLPLPVSVKPAAAATAAAKQPVVENKKPDPAPRAEPRRRAPQPRKDDKRR